MKDEQGKFIHQILDLLVKNVKEIKIHKHSKQSNSKVTEKTFSEDRNIGRKYDLNLDYSMSEIYIE